MNSVPKRIAIVLALLCVAVAVGAVLIPSKPDGIPCGSVVSPDWTDDQTDELMTSAESMYDRTAGSTMFSGYADAAVSSAMIYRRANSACEDARSTRTIVAGSATGLAVAIPLGMFFVMGGTARREPV